MESAKKQKLEVTRIEMKAGTNKVIEGVFSIETESEGIEIMGFKLKPGIKYRVTSSKDKNMKLSIKCTKDATILITGDNFDVSDELQTKQCFVTNQSW